MRTGFRPFRLVALQHMCTRIMILSSAFAIAIPLFAREKTDVVVMNNGDRLTGEIKGLDSGTLSVSFDYINGTSSVDWSKVDHLESKQLFLVKTQDGSVYTGALRTVQSSGKHPIQIEISESPNGRGIGPLEDHHMTETSAIFGSDSMGRSLRGFRTPKAIKQRNTISPPRSNIPANDGWPRANYNSTLASSTGATVSTRNTLDLYAGARFGGTIGFTRESLTSFKALHKESIFRQILGAALGGI